MGQLDWGFGGWLALLRLGEGGECLNGLSSHSVSRCRPPLLASVVIFKYR